MIKKLDALIIKAFIGPFLATFLITLFVLVMQFFWLYIDDLVGKGLDIFTLGKLTGYVAAFNIPMALPLALLLSSIMTYGNLGESYELIAIKSAGIPLLRFMQPIFVVSVLIASIAFVFANNIIPVVNLKLSSLKYDIIVTKPAFDIKEGVFYNKIDGYVIKIGKKSEEGNIIENVIIYEKNYGLQDYSLIAESGTMRVSDDKKSLEFDLKNGWRYQEKGNRMTTNTEFVRLGFKEYKKILDLSSFKINKTPDSALINYKMLSIRQLNIAIDSMRRLDDYYFNRSKNEIAPYLQFTRYGDSTWPKGNVALQKKVKNFNALITDSLYKITDERLLPQLSTLQSSLSVIAEDYKIKRKEIRNHLVEWHRKFTLSVACVVLFLIGAPLGSIIRKGGLGTPLVIAVIFFVIFHLFNTFGEKLAKSDAMTPLAGMWLSSAILIPIGIFFTYKAMNDSELFNKEYYYRAYRAIRQIVVNYKLRKS